MASEAYAYIDGACEIRLPPGRIRVQACKGSEYLPLDEHVDLSPGKLALRFSLERWADLRRDGWYSGDSWAFMTPHAAMLEAVAEDLAVVDVLVCECSTGGRPAIPNILAFSGQRPTLDRPGHLVVVNTLNRHSRLGQLALLNCHRVVYPLSFGAPQGVDDWTLGDWCDQCHRKGGLVVGHWFFHPAEGDPHGEVLADLILGKIDALIVNNGFDHPDRMALREWRALLDAGFRIPLVGGSGKVDNQTVLGGQHTYARLHPGQEFNYKNWTESLRAGRTFVTNGPLLHFSVNGHDPGAVLDLPSAPAPLRLRAEARSLRPFDRLEVVHDGAVVAYAEPAGSSSHATIETEVVQSEPGWLAARCLGPYDDDRYERVGAQTSPVYLQIGGKSPQPSAAMIAPFVAKLDAMLEWVAHEARCENDNQRQHLAAVFEAAKHELLHRQKA